jgi:hypothetical protein
MKFKEIKQPIVTADPWYDMVSGGYIKPEKLLEDPKEITQVRTAINVVRAFLLEAEEAGVIEMA